MAAVGLGTWRLEGQARLLLLWLLMLCLTTFYAQGRAFTVEVSLPGLLLCAAIGLGYAVAVVAIVVWGLRLPTFLPSTAVRLFGPLDPLSLLLRLAFVMAPVEELFFRGFVQREAGIAASALMGPLLYAIYFLPTAATLPLVLLLIAAGALLLYLACCLAYRLHGLPGSVVAHAVGMVAAFQGLQALQALGFQFHV